MAEYRSSSPTSDILSDEVETISIRDKALLKRSVSKHHNTNFKAGYVPVHEQHLTKTGLRGRKTFAFWALITLIFILAVGNLLLTITILSVLRIGKGMESIELVPDEDTIKFFGETDLGYLYQRDGRIRAFKDEPLEIEAEDSSVMLNFVLRNGRTSSQLRVGPNGTKFSGFESFEIKNAQGETVFSTEGSTYHNLRGVNTFTSKSIFTNKVVSPMHSKLKMEGRTVTIKGSEGTNIDGKEIRFTADQDIYLKSHNGSVVLASEGGVFIDVKNIPIARVRKDEIGMGQYKICVCMPQGKLFRIPVPTGRNSQVFCHHLNPSPAHNPCM